MKSKGITLIGMSGAGKTTLAPVLAEKLGWSFYDVDEILVKNTGKLINELLEHYGSQHLIELEVKCVTKLDFQQSVLSTPGSIVYGTACHEHLKNRSIIVWLDVPLDILKTRYEDDTQKNKGIIGIERGIESLFNERKLLYEQLADLRIRVDGTQSTEDIAQKIVSSILVT